MNHHTIGLLMKSHDLTPVTLAARANVGTAAMGAILSGTKKPNTRESKGLASAFNLSLEDFGGLPTPELDAMPEWQALRESLYRHGARHGWRGVGHTSS